MTTCTQYSVPFFGFVKNGEMVLNKWGKIVEQQILWMEKHFPYIKINEFIVMPNHVHAIIIIEHVGTILGLSLQPKQYQRRHNLLSKTINAFKTTSSKKIHQNGMNIFKWQRSFHDRIIRDEIELNIIRQYIVDNPKNWKHDRNNAKIKL